MGEIGDASAAGRGEEGDRGATGWRASCNGEIIGGLPRVRGGRRQWR